MNYDIIKRIGVLEGDPQGYRLEANIISWNGGQPKLDIRRWQPTGKPASGVCISEEGLETLKELLQDVTL